MGEALLTMALSLPRLLRVISRRGLFATKLSPSLLVTKISSMSVISLLLSLSFLLVYVSLVLIKKLDWVSQSYPLFKVSGDDFFAMAMENVTFFSAIGIGCALVIVFFVEV